MQSNATKRFALLLHAHRTQYGLEGDDETILVHLLGDAIVWCDQHRVDLMQNLESAQAMVRECEG